MTPRKHFIVPDFCRLARKMRQTTFTQAFFSQLIVFQPRNPTQAQEVQ